MIWRWQRPPRNPNPEIIEAPVIIAEGFELGGKLTLNRPAIVNGRLRGYIQSTAHVSLGPTAVIHGDISARSVTVAGTVIGNVTAEESIHLETGARVTGDLTAPAISISPGAARTSPALGHPDDLSRPCVPAGRSSLTNRTAIRPSLRSSTSSSWPRGRGRCSGSAGTRESSDAATDRSARPRSDAADPRGRDHRGTSMSPAHRCRGCI